MHMDGAPLGVRLGSEAPGPKTLPTHHRAEAEQETDLSVRPGLGDVCPPAHPD